MICYLPWNLNDMTGISPEKLQRNIVQQSSFIKLYRNELTKESGRFNIAGMLRHTCLNRESFGSDDISKKAVDCLIVFLHAQAFQKASYFAPTDAENPAVGKCVRNLHRLMLENLKCTMKYIDYTLLLRLSQGELGRDSLSQEREKCHADVFPNDDMPDICAEESINNDFCRIIENETGKAHGFADFDVIRNTSLPYELCAKLSGAPRQDAELPESEYGIIGSCKSYLKTPFIKYGNAFYSFVTAYSLKAIKPIIAELLPQEQKFTAVQESEKSWHPVPSEEPESQQESVEMGSLFDDEDYDEYNNDDDIETEEPNQDSAYVETDEYEYPDEFEEDTSNSLTEEEEEAELYDAAEDDQSYEPDNESKDPEEYYDEEPYTALISPDAYDYLEKTAPEEFTKEYSEDCYEDCDEDEDEEEEEPYVADPYKADSLFSMVDDTEEVSEPEKENEEVSEEIRTNSVYSEIDTDSTEETLEENGEKELDRKTEERTQEEAEEETDESVTENLPLIEQILRFSPSRSNVIAQYLASCNPEQKKEIVRVIELARKAWKIDGKDKMFTIPDTGISIAIFSDTPDPMTGIQRRENIGAVMYASQKEVWNSLELSYDSANQLVKADYRQITRLSFSDWEWKIVEKLGMRLMER
ncbi:MAG: hypothetical protein ACFN3H_04530, partial [Spirochaetales bacterium]